MTRQQVSLILAIIDSKLNEYRNRETEDGGLIESIQTGELVKDLFATIPVADEG